MEHLPFVLLLLSHIFDSMKPYVRKRENPIASLCFFACSLGSFLAFNIGWILGVLRIISWV